ncbi:MAG: FAD-binding domain-containing protein [Cyanobacteriota bacterium]|jgi:deoxyribodipyrimidine photo-lyase
MIAPLILLWHRRDLRLTDHLALAQALAKSSHLVGLFCLDPQILTAPDIAPSRVDYLLGCLQDLENQYRQLGSQLLLLQGNPIEEIPQTAEILGAALVVWTLDAEPYAQKRDQAVATALRERRIRVETHWDQMLHSPGEILTQSGQAYTVYGAFWKNWSQKPKAPPYAPPRGLRGLEAEELARVKTLPLPSLQALGFAHNQTLPLAPGTEAAQTRFTWFLENALGDYQINRNFPALDGTSQLSAALKFGVLGIRTLWQGSLEKLAQSRSEEERASIQTWQQELAWREFYQHCLYFFPALAQGPYRAPFQDFPWDDNEDGFQAWREGQTGYPIVDAALRQLKETGWMHNRCRMIVASFLTKDLILNWQQGELHFMQTLYDGDLAANNGGWQWSASSGMDPKPLRIFNPYTQAQKFDPEGDYIRRWLPELASFETGDLLRGTLTTLERRSVGYPDPIVDHGCRQQEFKRRYAQSKGAG